MSVSTLSTQFENMHFEIKIKIFKKKKVIVQQIIGIFIFVIFFF